MPSLARRACISIALPRLSVVKRSRGWSITFSFTALGAPELFEDTTIPTVINSARTTTSPPIIPYSNGLFASIF